MGRAIQDLEKLETRVARRALAPSDDEVAGRLAATMRELIETERLAAGSQTGAEHSDSRGRLLAMIQVRKELEAAAEALDRAGAHILEFYFERR